MGADGRLEEPEEDAMTPAGLGGESMCDAASTRNRLDTLFYFLGTAGTGYTKVLVS